MAAALVRAVAHELGNAQVVSLGWLALCCACGAGLSSARWGREAVILKYR